MGILFFTPDSLKENSLSLLSISQQKRMDNPMSTGAAYGSFRKVEKSSSSRFTTKGRWFSISGMDAKKSPLAGIGNPRKVFDCVSSTLNFASLHAPPAAIAKGISERVGILKR